MEHTTTRSMSGLAWGVIIAVIVIGGLIWYQAARAPQVEGGELYVGITDATAEIENINEISMEVEKVEIHSATEGWVTIAEDRKMYDLFKLKAEGKTEFYAKSKVEPGTYDRVRVTLGDTIIKTKENGDIKAYSPSNHVVLNMDINVAAEGDTHVQLDFLADKSLHSTGDGQYVFAPVISAESQSNTQVTVANDNSIATSGGTLDSSTSIGVDLSGASRTNFNLTTTEDLKVDASDENAVKFSLGSQIFTASKVLQEESMDGSNDANVNGNANLGGTVNGTVNGNSNTNTNTNSGSTNVDLDSALEGALDVDLQ